MRNYTAVLKKSGSQYVALCLELGVVGQGPTRSKALRGLREAIDSYLQYAKVVDLPGSRPVAIQQLHEFLFLDKHAKLIKNRNDKTRLTTLSYA